MKQRLNRLGVEIKPGRDRDEGEGQSLYFTDPDGHLLEFHTGNLAARLEAYREAGEEMTFYDHIFNGHGNSITGTLGTMNEEKAHIMITVANRLYVKPEHAEAFEKVFRERAGLVDGMPGFISNQVLRPVNEVSLTSC